MFKTDNSLKNIPWKCKEWRQKEDSNCHSYKASEIKRTDHMWELSSKSQKS